MLFIRPEIIPGSTLWQIYLCGLSLHKVYRSFILKLLSIISIPTIILIYLHYLFLSVLRTDYRRYKNGFAKHILVFYIPYILITGKIHYQSTHKARLTFSHFPRSGIYIRQQRITQINHLFNSIIYRFAFFPKLINFSRRISSMRTHHRSKCPEL